jgi:hypothetical protein
MIDVLKQIAQAMRNFRLPSIALGLIALVSAIVITFNSNTHEGDRFLIPSVVLLLWAMSTYVFIVNFSSIPEKPDKSCNIIIKLKRRVTRGYYWFISIVFIGTTVTAIWFSYRMGYIWLTG